MKIEVAIRPSQFPGVRAFANARIDGWLALNDMKVVEGSKGLFVSFPARKGKDGKYYDHYHPVTADGRTALQDAVLEAMKKLSMAQ